jgi:hypothetical protein
MLLAETNRIEDLLHLSFISRVKATELRDSEREVQLLLAELTRVFGCCRT